MRLTRNVFDCTLTWSESILCLYTHRKLTLCDPPAIYLTVHCIHSLYQTQYCVYFHTYSHVTPVAGLFLTRLGFEKIFDTQYIYVIFQNTQVSFGCTVERSHKSRTSLVNQYFSQREKYWLTKFEQLFRIRTVKSKAPTWRPQEISGFLKFFWVFRAHQSWTLLARILELL